MKFLNEKGQAALVDSLFFIAIVSTICTGLFYFAINYGLGTESLLNSFYSSDFAMDSLKVITYVNVMRDGSAVRLEDALATTTTNAQYDYLLALLKEDYARTKKIGIDSRRAIANTLYSVLKPFDDSIDYVFYIIKEGYASTESKFVTLIIATHQRVDCAGDTSACYCRPDGSGGVQCYTINRVFYSCEPTLNSILEKYVFPNVGKVDSANGKITLSDSIEKFSPYVIGLHTWIAKDVSVLSASNLVGSTSEFNCQEITGVNTLSSSPAP
jgi:hypothetical protein